MSVLSRFTNIMSLNIKSMLDKKNTSDKEVKKILGVLNDNLLRVKSEVNAIKLEETRARASADDINDEIDKLVRYSKKALDSGRNSEAKRFLNKKIDLSTKHTELENKYNIAKENSIKISQMYEKLLGQISELNMRSKEIELKSAEAKIQENKNKLEGNGGLFKAQEEKVDKILNQAEIMNELNNLDSNGEKDDFDELFAALEAEGSENSNI